MEETASKRDRDLWKETDSVVGRETAGESKEQQTRIDNVLGCYRFVYNKTLELKRSAYDKDKTNLGLTEISKWFHGILLTDDNYSWLREQNTKVMKQSIRKMLGAYSKEASRC